MKKLNVVYNDNYDIPLPEGHRFVGTKFSDLYNFIKNSNLYTNLTIHQSKSAPINDVQVVHNRDYVMSVKEGNLSRDLERRINFCLLYTSPSPRDSRVSRMPSSA